MNRKKTGARLACLVVAASLLGLASSSAAQEAYPTKPIEVVNSFAAGGINDLTFRAISTVVEKYLGQPMVQQIKAGGGGAVGTTEAALARPDGYKLLIASAGELVVAPNISKVSYTLDSFVPIARMVTASYTIVVRADARWGDIEQFIKEAKERPGQLSLATTRGGGYITLADFQNKAGVSLNHVPYPGFGPSLVALLGGHVDSALISTPVAEPQVQAGKARMLALTGPVRVDAYRNVPTLKELGIDVSFTQWVGMFAPRAIAPERLARLRSAFERVVKDQEFLARSAQLGVSISYLPGPEFLSAIQKEDVEVRALVKQLGIGVK